MWENSTTQCPATSLAASSIVESLCVFNTISGVEAQNSHGRRAFACLQAHPPERVPPPCRPTSHDEPAAVDPRVEKLHILLVGTSLAASSTPSLSRRRETRKANLTQTNDLLADPTAFCSVLVSYLPAHTSVLGEATARSRLRGKA